MFALDVIVESSPSVKQVNLARTRKHSSDHCSCRHVSKSNSSDANDLVRRKAGSYLIAAKGLLKQVNVEMNKVNSLYSINLN